MVEVLFVPPVAEPEFGPSMVEPCHNLSIQEILADYSRGIVHSTRQTFYDDGEDVPDSLDEIEDFSDLQVAKPSKPDKSAKADLDGASDSPASPAKDFEEGATKEATDDKSE